MSKSWKVQFNGSVGPKVFPGSKVKWDRMNTLLALWDKLFSGILLENVIFATLYPLPFRKNFSTTCNVSFVRILSLLVFLSYKM